MLSFVGMCVSGLHDPGFLIHVISALPPLRTGRRRGEENHNGIMNEVSFSGGFVKENRAD